MNKSLLRLLLGTHLFTLLFLSLMPLLIRWMGTLGGKLLYALMVMLAIGLALALRYALESLQ